MLNILIADDERGIIQLVKNLIDPSVVRVRVVGEAANGTEAYRKIGLLRPDVVITDIRMPGMNGLQLIEQVNREYPDTVFIVISGYPEFEYAQAALKFGTSDYLLKPIKKAELNGALLRIAQKKDDAAEEKTQLDHMEKQLSANTGLLRKNALLDLCSGKEERVRSALHTFRQEEAFPSAAGGWRCIARVLMDDPAKGGQEFSPEIIDALLQKIARALAQDCLDVETACVRSTGVLYLCCTDEQGRPEQKCSELDRLLSNDSYKYEFFNITVAFGKTVEQVQDLPESWDTAVTAGRSRIDLGPGRSLYYPLLPERVKKPADPLGANTLSQIHRHLANLDEKETCGLIRQLFLDWRGGARAASVLYELSREIIDCIYQELQNNMPDCQAPETEQSLTRLELCSTAVMLRDVCIEYASKAIGSCVEQRASRESRPVRVARQFMEEHYDQQITLEQLAKLSFLNPVYFSTIFKKETGVSFTAYLVKLRMDKACELLKTGSVTVAEAAAQVGYQDVRYFSRMFSKSVGIKPKEYKKFYS